MAVLRKRHSLSRDQISHHLSLSKPDNGRHYGDHQSRSTCPSSCPLRKSLAAGGTCYAEHGHLGGFIWTGLDKHEPGQRFGAGIRVYTLDQLSTAIRCLSPHSVWRHNQAGDLYASNGTIDQGILSTITEANTGRRGFTFTHHDVLLNMQNREMIFTANENGFRINLSANNLAHADQLASLSIARSPRSFQNLNEQTFGLLQAGRLWCVPLGHARTSPVRSVCCAHETATSLSGSPSSPQPIESTNSSLRALRLKAPLPA